MSTQSEYLFNGLPEFLRLFKLALGEKSWDEKMSNKNTAIGILSAIQKTLVTESLVTIPTAVSYLRELKILNEKNLEVLDLCGAVVPLNTALTHKGMAVLLVYLAKNEPGLEVKEQADLKEDAQNIQNMPETNVSSTEFFHLCSLLLSQKSSKSFSTLKRQKKE
jgi:hypothetical protein